MAQPYGPVTTDDPLGFRIVALLLRLAKTVGIIGILWLGLWWVVSLFGMTACTAALPQPENGRTFHLIASGGRHHGCNGYVKPWVGHSYHFMLTAGLILLIGFFALTLAFLIGRKTLAFQTPADRFNACVASIG
jgi:hypothetical protein